MGDVVELPKPIKPGEQLMCGYCECTLWRVYDNGLMQCRDCEAIVNIADEMADDS